jgi:hypothetical protein
MRRCEQTFALASDFKLTNPTEVYDVIRCVMKVGKAPGQNGIPNMDLKHLPLSVISLLVMIFNERFQIQYFPPAWKHDRMFSILVLSTHKSVGHDWQDVRENRTQQDYLRCKRTWATVQ